MSEVICVLPTWSGDQSMAIRLLRWISELGRVNTHCVVLCSDKCAVKQLMRCAEDAFMSAEWCQDREEVTSDWSREWEGNKSALGPNSMFNQAAWGAYMKWKKPFLFMEPDSTPLVPDWFEQLKAEYLACGKPMMGCLIIPTTDRNAKHLSGVSIYDHRLPQYVPEMIDYKLGGVAFDMAAPAKTLQFSHITKRILDIFRCPTFKSMGDYESRISKEVVLFAGSKDGSLIQFARQKRKQFAGVAESGLTVTKPGRTVAETLQVDPKGQLPSAGSNPATSTPVLDIYLKTYPKDYELANYCLKSIAKFVTGYQYVIIEGPLEIDNLVIPDPLSKILVGSIDRSPGYLDQQAKKLAAFKHSHADYLLYIDSDCCFHRPFDVSEMFKNGKSTWQYTPFTEARADQKSAWVPVMEKFLGKTPPNEFMRRHPHILPRWLPEEMDKFCRYRHGMTLDEYIMAQGDPDNPLQLSFSEFNCAGFFAWEFFRDKFTWITDAEAGPAPCLQGFTHGGQERIQQDIAKFRKILDQPDAAASPAPEPEKLPLDIKIVLDWLKQEAGRSGLHKARLVKAVAGALNESKPKAGPVKQRGKAHNRTGDKLVKPGKKDRGFLLCVHTFPGANEGLARHWSAFQSAGAAEIVVITTTDGGCKVPEGAKEVQIGANKYISGAHLPQRLVDTLEFCLSTPYNRYAIAEWDCLILKPLEFAKTSLYLTGGQVPGASAPQFFHSPWLLTREDARLLIAELRQIIQEGHCRAGKPDCSPDLALGLAVHRLGLKYEPLNIYSRNNLNEPGTLEIACQKAREGVVAIHGVKSQHHYNSIIAQLAARD